MSGRKTVWTDPLIDVFINQYGPLLGWQSDAMVRALRAEFGLTQTDEGIRQHALEVKRGNGLPTPPVNDIPEMEMRLPWKTVLVTADYQIPYHDVELVEKAFALGLAWRVEGHVINADFYDMATMSKFNPTMFGERIPLGEEIEYGKEILRKAMSDHGQVALLTGNHEWRILQRTLHSELKPEQARDLLALEGVFYTPLSYAWLGYDDEPVRLTHPKSQSVIAGAVGADIARNHDCHVVVAHDHVLAQRRSHSGRWTVTHSGMMAKPGRLGYAMAADDRRPRMNQGFVIIHPDIATGQPRIRLIDARNTDWDLEFWTARKERQ